SDWPALRRSAPCRPAGSAAAPSCRPLPGVSVPAAAPGATGSCWSYPTRSHPAGCRRYPLRLASSWTTPFIQPASGAPMTTESLHQFQRQLLGHLLQRQIIVLTQGVATGGGDVHIVLAPLVAVDEGGGQAAATLHVPGGWPQVVTKGGARAAHLRLANHVGVAGERRGLLTPPGHAAVHAGGLRLGVDRMAEDHRRVHYVGATREQGSGDGILVFP